MAGTCITTIKVMGAASLGLLTSSLTYQSIQEIPLLINQLNSNISINSNELLSKVSLIINYSRLSNIVIGGISSGLLTLAFKASSPQDKHPYIIYSALTVPLAIASIIYKSYKYEDKLLKKSKQVIPIIPSSESIEEVKDNHQNQENEKKEEETIQDNSIKDDESQLGKSYIHVSDEESSSNTSTPNSSAPSSPKQQSSETVSIDKLDKELSIEEEVENALYKKEYINDLLKVKSGYLIGSTITGLGFFMVVVGIIGDSFFL